MLKINECIFSFPPSQNFYLIRPSHIDNIICRPQLMFLTIKYHKLFSSLIPIDMKNTTRRDKLISLEQRARNIWERHQYFTVEPNQQPKFFQTFPYPYMNGLLHLGHAFSMTKCDFNAWYKRICGFNVLFPFGYHCTGMPISAAAKKLQFELSTYGFPPQFPPPPPPAEGNNQKKDAKKEEKKEKPKKQGKGKQQKPEENAKEGKKEEKKQEKTEEQNQVKYQYDILSQMKLPQETIPKFTDAHFWVKYFPPLGREHIKKFGLHCDHSRSFVTTDLNPYYDSFIRWQFTLLKERGFIKFGKRPSIYSPKDKQMCADHDRAEGEGVVPDEYTLIKIRITEFNERLSRTLAGRKVFLVAATLRPETMYGQTSCFVLPTGDYVAIEMKNDEVFICSERSGNNMAFQGLTKQDQKVSILDTFKGEELIGLPLSAPNAVHQRIYTLPMMTISMKKGTGVVTCVPSDAPDDWMATCDLRNKKAFRQKYGITEQMVAAEPVPLIQTSIGDRTAITLCQNLKIKSQNDKQLLQQAKDQAYKKGFHEGVMLIGNFKGSKVADAKSLVRKQLIDRGDALVYYQPGGNVVSRSGDVCVVSYCDQWYLNYADEDWKKRVLNHVQKNFKCNSETLHNDLIYTINWLREWGCSRSFGLGTKLPFDQQFLIESLSDSTIYFAFYTVSHLLQGDIEGSVPGLLGIRPEDITLDFWSHIFLGQEYKSGKIPQYKLDRCRESFLYWYPLDLRCSAKDLIKNHLTMALFNHAAIWEDEKFWPRSYYCNGYINVEGEKMSKSKGNFITLNQAIEQYGADAARIACAMAGDSINDANFTQENGNAGIMQLSTLEMFLGKALDSKAEYRNGVSDQEHIAHFDDIFENEIEEQIIKVREAYEKMIYRDVIKYGLHEFVSMKDLYLLNCDKAKPRQDLIERYIFLQLLFLYPICPHFCEVAYIDYFLPFAKNYKDYPQLLGSCRFPNPRANIDYSLIKSHQYYLKFMVNAREAHSKALKPKKGGEVPKITKGTIIYRQKFQDYQIQMLKLLRSCIKDGQIAANWRDEVKVENKEQKTKMLKFAGFIEKEFKLIGQEVLDQALPFSELKVLSSFISNIKREFPVELEIVEVNNAPDRENKSWKQTLANVTPGNPIIVFD